MLPAWYRYLVRIHSQKTVPLISAAGFLVTHTLSENRTEIGNRVDFGTSRLFRKRSDYRFLFYFLGTSDEKYPSVRLGTSVLVYLPTVLVCAIQIKTFVLHVTIVAL